MMTSTEKLLKKEFKLNSEDQLFQLIESQTERFFKDNFFTSKANYLKMIKDLIASINSDGEALSDLAGISSPGSVLSGSFTSSAMGSLRKGYQNNRKRLVNHVRFFIK